MIETLFNFLSGAEIYGALAEAINACAIAVAGFMPKLLAALQNYSVALQHLKWCCLNIGGYAEFYFGYGGLEIELKFGDFIAIALLWYFWRKGRIRRRPNRARRQGQRRRRRN